MTRRPAPAADTPDRDRARPYRRSGRAIVPVVLPVQLRLLEVPAEVPEHDYERWLGLR